MRIKFIKAYKGHLKGSILNIGNKQAQELINKGIAILTKDIVPDDYKQAGDKDGSITSLRTYNYIRR